jgi:nitroreductase
VEFQDVVRRRHMVREFTTEPVPQASLDRILANAVRGPSAGFSQGQAFLVLTDQDDLIDTGMAGLLILQTAVDEGLGGFYFGIVPEQVQPFRDAFGVPDDQEPIGAIAIGYSAETSVRSHAARRRPLADLVHYGSWQKP